MSRQSVVIRAAAEPDLDSIAAIQAASPEAAHWRPRDYLGHRCRVAVIGESVVAFVVWRTVADGENEILNVAVAPEYRRHGVAQRLIRSILQETGGAWFLEVRESNVAARTLYAGMGFTDAGIRHGYYEDSQESGIVMSFCS